MQRRNGRRRRQTVQQRPSSCPAGLTLLGPGRTSGSLPFLSAAEQRGLPDPPRPGTSPHRPPEVGSGTRTRPTRPRLRTAAGTGGGGRTVATRSGWRPGVCPGLPARGRFARPSVARRRPGTGAGPSALGPAGRRGGPPRPAPYLGSGSEWLCSVALSAAARFFPPPRALRALEQLCFRLGNGRAGSPPLSGAPSGSAPLAPLRPHHPPYPRWRRPSHGVSPPTLDGRRGCTKVGARGPAATNRRGRAPEPPRLPTGGAEPSRQGREAAAARPGVARPRAEGAGGKAAGGAGRGGRACPLSFSEAAPPPRVLAPQGGRPRVKALALRKTSGFSQLFVVEK